MVGIVVPVIVHFACGTQQGVHLRALWLRQLVCGRQLAKRRNLTDRIHTPQKLLPNASVPLGDTLKQSDRLLGAEHTVAGRELRVDKRLGCQRPGPRIPE